MKLNNKLYEDTIIIKEEVSQFYNRDRRSSNTQTLTLKTVKKSYSLNVSATKIHWITYHPKESERLRNEPK